MGKNEQYQEVRTRLESLLEGEQDAVTVMSTVACELFNQFGHFNWVGFYRVVAPGLLKVGPYQGGHGCLTIPFDRGVCGRCAREATTQVMEDVETIPYHIACSPETRSEIVVPLLDQEGLVRAVLDVDSDEPAAFDEVDQEHLEAIAAMLRSVSWGKAA